MLLHSCETEPVSAQCSLLGAHTSDSNMSLSVPLALRTSRILRGSSNQPAYSAASAERCSSARCWATPRFSSDAHTAKWGLRSSGRTMWRRHHLALHMPCSPKYSLPNFVEIAALRTCRTSAASASTAARTLTSANVYSAFCRSIAAATMCVVAACETAKAAKAEQAAVLSHGRNTSFTSRCTGSNMKFEVRRSANTLEIRSARATMAQLQQPK